jgi:hypothetical protein
MEILRSFLDSRSSRFLIPALFLRHDSNLFAGFIRGSLHPTTSDQRAPVALVQGIWKLQEPVRSRDHPIRSASDSLRRAFFFIAALPVVFTWRDLKQNVRSVIEFGFVVALPSAVWIAHNVRSSGQAVGDRRLLYHPVTAKAFREFLTNIGLWFSPPLLPRFGRLLVLAILLSIILGAIVSTFRTRRISADSSPHPPLLLAKMCIVFNCVYLAFLYLTMAILDASSHPNSRYLSPPFPLTALLIIASLALWGEKLGRESMRWRLLLTTCLLLVALNAARSWGTVRDIRQNGIGFQTAPYQDDEIFRVVRELPDNMTAYSDNPTLIYFWTKRALNYPPQKFELTTTQLNPGFEKEMNTLVELGNRQPVIFVAFGKSKDGPFLVASESIERWGFHPILQSSKGTSVLCSSACGTLMTSPSNPASQVNQELPQTGQ